ncbi:MAG: hypothetical protein KGL35_24870 [Bradyrhizobium sp.]|nr:hypothetical protein [Bradyrhizobium sp.]
MDDAQGAELTSEDIAAHEEQQAEARRRAALMAHPHTQLNKILTDLRAPAANQADVNTRLAHLHAAVRQLVQVVLSHTPRPEEPHEG